LKEIGEVFGARYQENVPLAKYTAARIGGPAERLIEVQSAGELVEAAELLWRLDVPFTILGGGSNVLVSDKGVRGVVVLNRARRVEFVDRPQTASPFVWAESGANFGLLARQAAQRGLGGLEWAAGIPGTLGGAVVGNAGAHGGDTAGQLDLAEILHLSRRPGDRTASREEWPNERMGFAYRTSTLKKITTVGERLIVLAARLRLTHSTPEIVQARIDEFVAFRRRTQPPGASMGSMFKNPPGDYSGRLIEAAGLKGARMGEAEISSLHANFFINHGRASAAEVYSLIQMARRTVEEKFGVRLELEIELVGEWGEEEG
jgi:UDP-N-acetylmuramate dehydrogenase